jgi:hypothetical protein
MVVNKVGQLAGGTTFFIRALIDACMVCIVGKVLECRKILRVWDKFWTL